MSASDYYPGQGDPLVGPCDYGCVSLCPHDSDEMKRRDPGCARVIAIRNVTLVQTENDLET